MYCVECGSEEKVYESLCKACFIKRTSFFQLPKVVHITICPNCSAWEKAKHWENATSEEDAITQSLNGLITVKEGIKYSNLSLELKPYKTNTYIGAVKITGIFDDLKIIDDLTTEIRVSYGTCGRCSRLSGSYFEAIIQVRSTKRSLTEKELAKSEEIVDEILAQLEGAESNAFLSKIEYIHGGEDFYLGSSTAARQIAKRLAKDFAGKVTESSSLAGRKDGREVYRITYTVRIPEFKAGDFIKLDGKVYLISGLNQKRISGLELSSHERSNFKPDAVADAKYLGGSELISDAVVVLESDKEVQILDPDNYKTVELIKPKDYKITGKMVKIIKVDEDIYLLTEPL